MFVICLIQYRNDVWIDVWRLGFFWCWVRFGSVFFILFFFFSLSVIVPLYLVFVFVFVFVFTNIFSFCFVCDVKLQNSIRIILGSDAHIFVHLHIECLYQSHWFACQLCVNIRWKSLLFCIRMVNNRRMCGACTSMLLVFLFLCVTDGVFVVLIGILHRQWNHSLPNNQWISLVFE